MLKKHFIFALFAAAILLSVLREWNAPLACARDVLLPRAEQNSPLLP
jgi:hypothetical protein